MFATNNKISSVQLKRILVLSTVGISSMMTTGIAAEYAVRDGIFCILLAYCFTLLYTCFVLYLCEKTEWNYFSHMDKYAGHKLTNVLSLIFILKYIFLLIPAVCFFVKLSRISLIMQRPIWFVMLPVVLLSLFLAAQGLEAIGRLAQCLYAVTLAVLLLILVLNIKAIDKFYIAPLFNFSAGSMICGSLWIFLLFSPMELILYGSSQIDAGDFKKRKQIKSRCYQGITITYILNLLYYLVNVGVLSINGIYADRNTPATMQLLNRIRISDILLLFFLLSIFFSLSVLILAILKLSGRFSGHRKITGMVTLTGVYLCYLAIFYLAPEFTTARFTSENRSDIESRIYTDAVILSHDTDSGRYTMSLVFPRDSNGDSVTDKVSADSLSNLIFEYGLHSDKQLDFSHTEVLLISKTIYDTPDLFRDTVNYLNSLNKLNHRTILCGIDTSPEEFLEADKDLDTELGQYISNLMKNNLKFSVSTLEQLKKVDIGAENACVISNFIISEGVPKYEGCTILNADGGVEYYSGNNAAMTNLALGKKDYIIELGSEHCYKITDNEYYIHNTVVSSKNVTAKIIYTGTMTGLKKNDLSEKEINRILESVIFERLTHLKDDFSCDLLNIYKHLAIDDHRLYAMYSGSRQELYDITYIEVECRFTLQQ